MLVDAKRGHNIIISVVPTEAKCIIPCCPCLKWWRLCHNRCRLLWSLVVVVVAAAAVSVVPKLGVLVAVVVVVVAVAVVAASSITEVVVAAAAAGCGKPGNQQSTRAPWCVFFLS